jgi:hypothetical protein
MSFIINPYRFAAAGGAQLLNEQFEAPGATGWVSQTTAPYASWNDQYTPAIVGGYSGQVASAGTARVNAYKNFTGSGSCYMRFQFRSITATVGNATLCTLRDASGNILATIGLVSGSSNFRVSIGAGASSNAGTAPAANTNLYGWLEYIKGTGSNAIARAGWTTTPARPSWPTSGASGSLVAQINGTATADAARVMFGTNASLINYNIVLDDIQIQATPFA